MDGMDNGPEWTGPITTLPTVQQVQKVQKVQLVQLVQPSNRPTSFFLTID